MAGAPSRFTHQTATAKYFFEAADLRNHQGRVQKKTLASSFAKLKIPTRRIEGRKANAGTICEFKPLTKIPLSHNQLSVILPMPPSINNQYATINGRRVLSSLSRKYKSSTAQSILATLAQFPDRQILLHSLRSHYLTLSIRFYLPTLLKRDLDGGLKITQDAICEALDINDNRIFEIHLYKDKDSLLPRIECILATQNPIKEKSPIKRRNPHPLS